MLLASFLRGFFGPTSLTIVHSHPTAHLIGLSQLSLSSLSAQVTGHSGLVSKVKHDFQWWSSQGEKTVHTWCLGTSHYSSCTWSQKSSGLPSAPMRSKIRQTQTQLPLVWHPSNLPQPLFASALSPPVFRALSSEQPRSSPLPEPHGFPGTQLPLPASKALQAGQHHWTWRELLGCLKRPSIKELGDALETS